MGKKKIETKYVVNGQICINCHGCGKDRMTDAPSGNVPITVKCSCGAKTRFQVEWRTSVRKKINTKGVLDNELGIVIFDISEGGLSFESYQSIIVGTVASCSFNIPLDSGGYQAASLNIKIVSKKGKRYGAEMLDLQDYSKVKMAIRFLPIEP